MPSRLRVMRSNGVARIRRRFVRGSECAGERFGALALLTPVARILVTGWTGSKHERDAHVGDPRVAAPVS